LLQWNLTSRETGLFAVIEQILPSAVLVLFLASNVFAQGNITDPTEKGDRRFKAHEISFVRGPKSHNEEIFMGGMKQVYIMAEPSSKEYDFNDILKENMAWDKDILFQKLHPQNYHLSVGIIKLNKIMCGAMLRVKFH
jgi:hypothetical protein